MRLNEAYEIIKNGIPIDDVESEIKLLEFKLQQLYDKQNRNDEKCFLAFIDDLIKEREIEGKDIKAYTSIKQILQSLIYPKDDFPINSISKDFLKRLEIQLRERKVKSNSIKTYFRMIKTIFDESKTKEELRKDAIDRNKASLDEVLIVLADIIRFDPKEMYDEDGNLLSIHQMPKKVRMCIQSFEVEEGLPSMGVGAEGISVGNIVTKKVKHYDKLSSVEKLMRHLGGYRLDNEQKAINIFQPDDRQSRIEQLKSKLR